MATSSQQSSKLPLENDNDLPPPAYSTIESLTNSNTPLITSTSSSTHTTNPTSRPPAGRRFPCHNRKGAFPSGNELGSSAFRDLEGNDVYIASALVEGWGVIPCKASAELGGCRIGFAGIEYADTGKYDILLNDQSMEWVITRKGQIPRGRIPVEGGYEADGRPLYHACFEIKGQFVPGKTGVHLGAATAPFGGKEVVVTDNYQILCWRK